jgi:hypothetical protein
VLLVVLVVLLLAAVLANVFFLSTRALPGRDGEAIELQGERDAVMAQARQFMLRSYTYGPDDLDDAGQLADNRSQVEEVVTDKFFSAYEESIAYIEQLVQTQGVGQSAKVLGVGVQYLDDDSARALVAGESTFNQRGEDGTTDDVRSQTYRMVIDLVKVDGTWLVDESNVAEDAAAETDAPDPAAPSGSPASESPTPSEEASP